MSTLTESALFVSHENFSLPNVTARSQGRNMSVVVARSNCGRLGVEQRSNGSRIEVKS